MGFLDNLRGKKLAPKIIASINKYLGTGTAIFNINDTDDIIRKGYMYNPNVYAVIQLIVNAASGVPFELYEVKDKKAYSRYSRAKNSIIPTAKGEYYKSKALEKIDNSELLDLLANPNPLQGEVEFTQNVLGYKLLTGNSYINLVSPLNGVNKGIPQQMYVLPAHLMEITSSGNAYSPIGGYELSMFDKNLKFKPEEVIHMKYWNPNWDHSGSHLYGQSPLKASQRVIQVDNDNYTANAKLLQNMGAIGILSGDGTMDFTEEQLLKIKQKYKDTYAGADRMGEIILASSKLTWQKMGMSISDLGILEARKFNLRDICNAYGVNSALLNDPDNKVYANAKEARKGLYIDVAIPLLDSYISELNRTVVKQYSKRDGKEYVLAYDINSVPEIQQDLAELRTTIKDIWELTPNQRLDIMGFDKSLDPSMDMNWIPSNLVPMQGSQIDLGKVGDIVKGMDYDAK
jgi:HK97 family phage portal protein